MSGNPGLIFVWLIFLVVVMYFVMIRPQQKRMAAHRNLVSSLAPGERVVTIGGIHGTLVDLEDDKVTLEIADNTIVTLSRSAIAGRVEDGAAKADVEASTDKELTGGTD